VIRRNVRSIDTVGRWGGEEFLVICPRIDREGIHRLAERLRSCLESVTLAAGALVTVCCGVALHRRGESVEQLIGRADQALYRAKDQGRNRVTIT
jgi:diguanylate cyclase (GGDEF)-like protein